MPQGTFVSDCAPAVIAIAVYWEDVDPGIKRCLAARQSPSFDFRRDRGCAAHRTRGHCALSAMLTVSELLKSFAGRALFDDMSLQVNRGDLITRIGFPLVLRWWASS